ncbi:MAG TPA: hypothetical protein VEC14_17045 [Reyranellaceae bacterium]|nr:hypothetical protein [Reyranellaceae bacterium]
MTSDIDICNRALSRLGTRATIAALSEDSTEARTAAIWYAATRDALLRAADWNFARRRVALAELGTPPTGWAFRYALPTDCLRLLRLASTGPGLPAPRFEVAGDAAGRVVLCDEPAAQAIYTARVEDPTLFDAAFAAALVDQLAAHIAYPVTQKTEVAVRLAQMARASFAEAVAMDGAEAAGAGLDAVPDWIAARA